MQTLAVIALFVAAATATVTVTLDADASWTAWKLKYGKTYLSAAEDSARQAIFNKNVAYINKHNARTDVTFTLGMNQFGDLTNAEFQATYLRPFNASKRNGLAYQMPNSVDPTSVDWRTQGYVTPIKDQGQCGSCWSFSTTGSFEGAHFKSTGKLVSFSEQNLVDCSGSEGNQGCNGGLMDYAFEYVIKNKGLDTEASYPYTARDGTCKYNPANSGGTLSKYVDVTAGSEAALQSAVATVGPISVAIDASHNSFQFYKSGIYNEPLCSSKNLDHGVLAVGYGATAGKNYWIVKNSWGTSWGNAGYIEMTKDKRNQCGIATAASYPIV
jgi:cathepsin L